MIRKADPRDLEAVTALYEEIHSAEEAGRISTGWKRGIYPSRDSALAALARQDLYVLEEGGRILGSAVINQIQVDVYAGAPWKHTVPDSRVCVLHTLTISPDTNAVNQTARAMYRRHGYEEIAIVPTVFNGIPDVRLVLLEKYLDFRPEEKP